ncbi:MAG: rhodanese-like domain-containing protein [Deltaproteobacteria bacterium]|jgi:rhodanese-related sulfurtransferase|nr:rhodanese-like domain-containing protein [Deltaproteobacteria bacterium]MBT6501697.1 rhodanese-like domain-containing protein [Deltaproteobacteria bacterium]
MTIDDEWQKIRVNKIVPKKLAALFKEKNLYILDVRPLDFKKNTSFIKGTLLCPLVYLSDRYMELPKEREIIITDWAMKQSPTAAKFLTTKGYNIIGVLKGGIERWESEKFPVENKEPSKEIGL